MKAKDVMTERVITVDENTPVAEVARTLSRWRISAVPVIDTAGRVIGIVSEGDLIHRPQSDSDKPPSWWLDAFAEPDARAIDYAKSHGRSARDVMTSPVVTVTEDASLSEIAQLLEENQIKRVPVVRRSNLVGIVSRANLIHGLGAADVSPQPARDEDGALRATLLNTLRNEADLRLESLNVTVSGGVVHLWGMAISDAQKDAIRVLAENTAGVKAVRDHLTVIPEFFQHWLQTGQ
jgi:CBS domain-containing protein